MVKILLEVRVCAVCHREDLSMDTETTVSRSSDPVSILDTKADVLSSSGSVNLIEKAPVTGQ